MLFMTNRTQYVIANQRMHGVFAQNALLLVRVAPDRYAAGSRLSVRAYIKRDLPTAKGQKEELLKVRMCRGARTCSPAKASTGAAQRPPRAVTGAARHPAHAEEGPLSHLCRGPFRGDGMPLLHPLSLSAFTLLTQKDSHLTIYPPRSLGQLHLTALFLG